MWKIFSFYPLADLENILKHIWNKVFIVWTWDIDTVCVNWKITLTKIYFGITTALYQEMTIKGDMNGGGGVEGAICARVVH
jgi:hypothetical protein